MVAETVDQTFALAKKLIDDGDVRGLELLCNSNPDLCAARNSDATAPTLDNAVLLHATSWPGGRPNGAEVVKTLVLAGADPALRFNGTGESVLHWAASMASDIAIVDTLIECGADIDAQGGVICGGTPLMNALYFGHVETGALLQRKGAFTDNIVTAAGLGNIDRLEYWYQSHGRYLKDAALTSPLAPTNSEEYLSEEATQSWTYRAAICALVCEQYQVVDWLIDHGFDVNLIPKDADWSCLHHAAYCGSLPMAMYLVAKGADIEIREENNATPAGYGVAHGHPEVMQYLVDLGTKLNVEEAAFYGRLDKVMLGYAQCDDRLSPLKMTIGNVGPIGKPIHSTIKRGRVAVAKYLIQREPELLEQVADGKTVTEFAEECRDQYWLTSLQRV
ncbi:MAG: ankyrin repeat domain-containing protein [Pseudomonadales bacterium]